MSYGMELILDLTKCDVSRFNRELLRVFFKEICIQIDMKREDLHFWDFEDNTPDEIAAAKNNPHIFGVSAVQFILTSSIVVHTLPLLGACYINIFSCKKFDPTLAARFASNWFHGIIENSTVVKRGRSCPSTQ